MLEDFECAGRRLDLELRAPLAAAEAPPKANHHTRSETKLQNLVSPKHSLQTQAHVKNLDQLIVITQNSRVASCWAVPCSGFTCRVRFLCVMPYQDQFRVMLGQ